MVCLTPAADKDRPQLDDYDPDGWVNIDALVAAAADTAGEAGQDDDDFLRQLSLDDDDRGPRRPPRRPPHPWYSETSGGRGEIRQDGRGDLLADLFRLAPRIPPALFDLTYHAALGLQAEAAERAKASPACAVPAFTVPPPSEAEVQAEEAAAHLEGRLKRLYKARAARGPGCGRVGALHLRRGQGGQVEDALVRLACGRSDCPHCWRKRRAKACRRAAAALLATEGPVHVGETTWERWDALDKAIRRRHGGDCCRLRVRRGDDTVLVVAESPFPGSRPCSPAEALGAVAVAVLDCLSQERHSFRLLGDWADRHRPEWRFVARLDAPMAWEDVRREVEALGARARRLEGRPDLQVLLWRCDSEEAAQALADDLHARLSEFSPRGGSGTQRPNSDSGDGGPPGGGGGGFYGGRPDPFPDSPGGGPGSINNPAR
jgi:hypothetical protein